MKIDEKLDIINTKVDAVFEMLSVMPLFIKAPMEKHVRRSWESAVLEYQRVTKEYKETLKNEHIHHIACVPDTIPRYGTKFAKRTDIKTEQPISNI